MTAPATKTGNYDPCPRHGNGLNYSRPVDTALHTIDTFNTGDLHLPKVDALRLKHVSSGRGALWTAAIS